jgi:predicted chitinase
MPSENGWNPSWVGLDSLQWVDVPGCKVRLQFMKGWPLQVLRAFAADYNAYVEPLRDRDSASYTPTNSVATSNHLNGTGMDLNWDSHPFHVKGTFTAAQMRTIRELLEFYEGTVFWAGDWRSPIDEMHWQMGYGTWNNPKVGSFIARKVRSDGFSTFRRGNIEAKTKETAADVLAAATGLPLDRASAVLSAVRDGLVKSDCLSPNRIAMWLAQIGHESDSFRATEEYASGDESTDRWKYKGRTWIQITWKANYAQFSKWAFDRGICSTPTYFVDNPRSLAELKYAGIGAAWYWTAARTDINSLSDARNITAVTQRINGGQNGADDRKRRFTLASAQGEKLTQLVASAVVEKPAVSPPEGIEELFMSDKLYESVSLYKTPGEGAKYTLAQLIQSIDGQQHRETVEAAAFMGSVSDIDRIAAVAAGRGAYRDAGAVNHAKSVLARLEKENPAALQAWLDSKGKA